MDPVGATDILQDDIACWSGRPSWYPKIKLLGKRWILAIAHTSHDWNEAKKGTLEELITETQKERLIQREEVIRVLDKAYQNQTFWRELMENGSEALKDYRLSRNAKAAIVSGDLKWIRENIGELTEDQLLFIYKRLEREAW